MRILALSSLLALLACGDDDTTPADTGPIGVDNTTSCNNLADGVCPPSCPSDPDCAPPMCNNLADGMCPAGCASDPDCAPPMCNNLADGVCPAGCVSDPDCSAPVDAGVVDTSVAVDTSIPPGDGGDPMAECLARAMSPSETCACSMCLTQLTTCENDPACVAIRECARTNMCRGIDCYGLLVPGPCREVIDMAGGVGAPSTNAASALSDCVTGMCES